MFVGESLAPSNNKYSKLFWKYYLEHPNRHLFDRDYDAVGFYAHLQDVGVDVWHLLLPMVTHDSLTAYHMAVNQKPQEFLTTWGASWFREGPSKEWHIDGPRAGRTGEAARPTQLRRQRPDGDVKDVAWEHRPRDHRHPGRRRRDASRRSPAGVP